MKLAPRKRFQDMILALEQYWGAQGCVLLQPHDAHTVSYTHLTLPTICSV